MKDTMLKLYVKLQTLLSQDEGQDLVEYALVVALIALAATAGKMGGLATLLKVFLPYLVWNTVFDNSRVVAEMGRKPAPFSEYCYPLLRFSRENNFAYRYRDWPSAAAAQDAR